MLEYTHESIGVRIDRRGAGLSRLVRHTTRVDQPSFGDIWFWFVSVSPAPHIYQRGELVREPLCTIHGHYPDYLVVGPAGQGGNGSHGGSVTGRPSGASSAFAIDRVNRRQSICRCDRCVCWFV